MKKKLVKAQAGKIVTDSTAYFRKKFDDAYNAYKAGKLTEKEAVKAMNAAGAGQDRQVKKSVTKKMGGSVKKK